MSLNVPRTRDVKTTHPNVLFAGGCQSVAAAQSAVFVNTVLPHHVWRVVRPIVPFLGNSRAKKIKMVEMARPESRPADKTSNAKT